jgi:SNF2 family DNA or RNA helicase
MFPHQRQGAARLVEGKPTYLGFDMGIGKTRTFIEAVKARSAKRVLVLCPASALLVWKREIQFWHPNASFIIVRNENDLSYGTETYYIVSHGLMSQKPGPVPEALATGLAFDMTAIDEAHAYNAADTNRVKALRRAAPKLGQIVPLSGTPMRNHAGDLYTLLSICWPEGLKGSNGVPMARHAFEERFCRVTHKTFGGSRMIRVIEGSKNLDQLKTMIAPFMLRVRKQEVFKDLPAINWDQVPVPLDHSLMPGPEAEQFEQAINSILVREGPTANLDVLTEALRVMGNSVVLATLRRMLGIAKLRGATDYIIDMLDNLPEDRKVLVFAHHAHVISALCRHLGEYSPAVLVGTTSPKDREAAVDKFLNAYQCRVFIGNIQAAGTAITLVGPNCQCSDVVFVESSWTPMDNAQAACRVHRIGQNDGVVARMLSAAGTVDDLINSLLVRKAREFTQLFDDGKVQSHDE